MVYVLCHILYFPQGEKMEGSNYIVLYRSNNQENDLNFLVYV